MENREASNPKSEDLVFKHEAISTDHNLEHETTVKHVFKNHPALVWWCFYWAMAAIGW